LPEGGKLSTILRLNETKVKAARRSTNVRRRAIISSKPHSSFGWQAGAMVKKLRADLYR